MSIRKTNNFKYLGKNINVASEKQAIKSKI